MSTKKADQKANQKANRTALKGFETSKIRAAFEQMAELRTGEETNAEARSQAALNLCKYAHAFRTKQDKGIPADTIVEGWRSKLALVIMELAVAGNKFATLTEGKDDKPATAKLTGYGNNVASIAKGVIEHEIEPGETYTDTRKAVEAARLEERRLKNPELAAVADARTACDEAWQELRKAVYSTEHPALITALTDELTRMKAELMAKPEAQPEADADDETGEAEAEPEAKAA